MKRLVPITVFLITALFLAPAWAEDISALYNRAKEILDDYSGEAGLLAEAADNLSKILEIDPNNALAYAAMARVSYKSGYINYDNYEPESLKQAHEFVDKALAIDPNLVEAYLANGHTYFYEKDFASAKKMIEQMERIQPGSLDAKLLSAQIDRKEKNDDAALTKAKEIIAANPEPRILLASYGILTGIYRSRKQYDLADELYLKGIELKPNSAWSKINYSSFLIIKGDYDKAIAMAQAALQLMDFGMGHKVLSEAYYKKGVDLCWDKKDYEPAAENFKLALAHYPDDANSYYGLGVCCRFIADAKKDEQLLKESENCLRKAIELNPGHEQAKKELEKHLEWTKQKK